MKRYWLGLTVLACTIGVLGCGPSYSKVEGKVEYEDGGPVEGATVVFMPTETGGAQASGQTDSQGNFTLKTGTVTGAKKGKYKVVITKVPPAPLDGAGDPSSKDAIKMMAKGMAKGGPGAGSKMGPPKSNNELQDIYSTSDKTPHSADIPASGALSFKVKKAKK